MINRLNGLKTYRLRKIWTNCWLRHCVLSDVRLPIIYAFHRAYRRQLWWFVHKILHGALQPERFLQVRQDSGLQHVLVVLLIQNGELMEQGDCRQVLRHRRQRRYRLGQHAALLQMALHRSRLFVFHVYGCWCWCCFSTDRLFRWMELMISTVHLQSHALWLIVVIVIVISYS